MVGAVDLLSICEPTSGDVSGLWAYLQQIVGQPFLFFRPSYGDELTLHLGTPREPASPKLRHRLRGSYVLTLRGSIWQLQSGPQQSLVIADPFLKPHPPHTRQLDLVELEKAPPIEPGSPIEWARPYQSDAFGGFELFLGFADNSRFMVSPAPSSPSDTEADSEDLPQIADWELFTPYGRYLRVGPGPTWAYLPSASDERPVA